MTMDEFVRIVETIAPKELACEWDNSGLLLRSGETVKRALIALDVTMAVADEAISGGFDMILAHHPTLFSPVRALDYRNPTDAVIMKLVRAGVSLYAAHTTFDKAVGGINDMLAKRLGLQNVVTVAGPEDGLMRMGTLPQEVGTDAFLELVKQAVDADALRVTDWQGGTVRTVAVLGGSGRGLRGGGQRSGCGRAGDRRGQAPSAH